MLRTIKKQFDVVIIPGSRHTLQEYWYPQLATQLRNKGLNVLYPKFPSIGNQNLDNWNQIMGFYESLFTNQTIFIGHSLGGRFLFNYLQNHKAGAAFFISAPYKQELDLWKKHMVADVEARELIEKNWESTNGTFFREEINWERIMRNVEKIHLFYSDRDNLIPIIHPFEIQKRIGGDIHWIKNGRHLDVDLKRIPELTQTILKTYYEINALHPEGQVRRKEF